MDEVVEQKFDYSLIREENRNIIKIKTAETKILIRQTAQGIIEIGQNLIEVKKDIGHGNWLPWLEAEFRWSRQTAKNFMNVAENFKSQTVCNLDFAPKALYLLAQNNASEGTRQTAIDHAKAGEQITAKVAKELKDKDKEIEDMKVLLNEKTKPDINKLISELKTMLDNRDIQPAVALNYSQLSPEDQEAQLLSERSRLTYLSNWQRLEAEKKEMQNTFDDAVNESTNKIIADKDAEIKQAEKDIAQSKIDIRKQLEDSIRLEVDKEYQDDIIKANKAKEKAEKGEKLYKDKSSNMSKEITKMGNEIKKLEDIEGINSPENIDYAMERRIMGTKDSIASLFDALDMDLNRAGEMPRSINAIAALHLMMRDKINELRDTSMKTIGGE